MKKFRFLLLVGAVVLEVGCGLPDSYYLAPPISTAQASPTLNFFTFANPIHDLNHDINVNFTGDELYYKLYSDSSQINGNDYDPSNSADPSTQLVSKGFFPLCLWSDPVGSRTDPVIDGTATASAGSSVTVTINSASGTTSYYILNTNPSVEIRRDTPNSISQTIYKNFLENNPTGTSTGNGYVQADPDFAAIYGTISGGSIYVAWYAISFGYTLSATPVRSVPAYLGYSSIPYP